jgi:hypothetical protein
MVLTEWPTAEVVTAVGVGFGALMGGLSALIKELRDHNEKSKAADETAEAEPPDLQTTIDAEFQHLGRTIWIVEKRLSDRLQRLEARLGTPDQRTEGKG